MGIVCGKTSSAIKDSEESPKKRELIRKTSELRAIASKRDESFRAKKRLDGGEIKVHLVDKKLSSSRRVRDDQYVKEKDNFIVGFNTFSGVISVPKAAEGEQVAAGWPSWLAEVAGEAIQGWIPRKANTFGRITKIGQGTYSSVYKAKDLLHNKFVALKKVRFDNMDPESVRFMAREIRILRRLDHPNIIKLEGLVASRSSNSLYLVFEYMEHDLTGISSIPGIQFTETQIKCYMQQLLSGLDHCHSRGYLHRDIKGSNLLLNDHGVLKIADFGLATFYDHHQKNRLTSRVVTLWYRPPELLLGENLYGVGVDLWSTGCILGELYTGKPIMPGKTEIEQLHKIFKLCGSPSEDYWRRANLPHTTFKPQQPYRRRVAETFSDLPAAAVGLLETLLSVDPADRGTAADSLRSEFFTTKPYACDPSSLPKYPPSKEMDAKLREDEARQGIGSFRLKDVSECRQSRERHAVPAPDANAELDGLMQSHGSSKTKSRGELFRQDSQGDASIFPFNQPRPRQAASKDPLERPPRRFNHSGPLNPGVGWTKSIKKSCEIPSTSPRANLSAVSGLVASRALLPEDSQNNTGRSHLEASTRTGRTSESFRGILTKQELKQQNFPSFHQAEGGKPHSKEPILHGHGWKRNKIQFSGPILGPSNNVDEMLKERDRRFQEVARQARLSKNGVGKVQTK